MQRITSETGDSGGGSVNTYTSKDSPYSCF